jgi:hypothetical protein
MCSIAKTISFVFVLASVVAIAGCDSGLIDVPLQKPESKPWSVNKEDTRSIARLTGPGSINKTPNQWGIGGTDLGSMFVHDGAIYMLFGDTFGAFHRSNVMAKVTDTDPRDGLTFASMITNRAGNAKELVGKEDLANQRKTVIATQGVSVNGRMYMHYMALKQWGSAGEWQLNRSGLAYSDDDGQTWTVSDVTWPGDSNFGQVAFVEKDSSLYLMGIPGGRFGAAQLAKVDKQNILDKSEYQYWNGEAWTAAASDAATMIPAPVGELSVRWNSHYRKWILMTKKQERRGDGYGIVLRTAECLTGSWSDEKWVVTDEEVPRLYAPYMPPTWNDGPIIYFTLSRFNPVYDVFWWRTSLKGGTEGTESRRCIVN